jgi:transposase
MTDGTATMADLASDSYEARKSPMRDGRDPRVEVRVRPVRRRTWSTEDRLRIVRETLEPGAVAKAIADRHGISTGLLYTWRKQMLATAMAGFVPVEVVPDLPQQALPAPPLPLATTETAGALDIVLPNGASIRVTGAVDAATLRVVLSALGGR